MSSDAYGHYAAARLRGEFGQLNSWRLVKHHVAGKRMLDVGCSDGAYLWELDPESVGVEQMPELAERARDRGHEVIVGQLDDVLKKMPAVSFDGVLASHVLEHVRSPLDTLASLHRVMKPGGTLIVGLPTERNIFRNSLRLDYFAGTHLYSFTTRNCQVLLNEAGFELADRIIFHLPKLKGRWGAIVHRAWNHPRRFVGREFFSLAYWMVATKRAEP